MKYSVVFLMAVVLSTSAAGAQAVARTDAKTSNPPIGVDGQKEIRQLQKTQRRLQSTVKTLEGRVRKLDQNTDAVNDAVNRLSTTRDLQETQIQGVDKKVEHIGSDLAKEVALNAWQTGLVVIAFLFLMVMMVRLSQRRRRVKHDQHVDSALLPQSVAVREGNSFFETTAPAPQAPLDELPESPSPADVRKYMKAHPEVNNRTIWLCGEGYRILANVARDDRGILRVEFPSYPKFSACGIDKMWHTAKQIALQGAATVYNA